MKKRTSPGKCASCCPCVRFRDDFIQCHGGSEFITEEQAEAFSSGFITDDGTHSNGTCIEWINGYDALRDWFSDRDNIFLHKGFKTQGRVVDGFIQADVSVIQTNQVARLYCTTPLPRTFSMGVDCPPPAYGTQWSLCFQNEKAEVYAVEVKAPAEAPTPEQLADPTYIDCYSFRILDKTCEGSEAVLDDRTIPFYFAGSRNRLLTVSICINESKSQIVVGCNTYSEIRVECPDGREVWQGVNWDWPHHASYAQDEHSNCTTPLHCYPTWIEIPLGILGHYEWGGTWILSGGCGGKDEEFHGSFDISKAKGVRGYPEITGICSCDAAAPPLFSDTLNRADEHLTPVPNPIPYDSTNHIMDGQGDWFVQSGKLKTALPSGAPTGSGFNTQSSYCTYANIIEETAPSTFFLTGWDTPHMVSVKVKFPPRGYGQLMTSIPGYRVHLRTSDVAGTLAGELHIRKGTNFNDLGTQLAFRTVGIVDPNEEHTLQYCWNGKIFWASLIKSNQTLPLTLHIAVEDIGDTSLVRLVVPSVDGGNVVGDYTFDEVTVTPSTDLTLESGSGSGSGPIEDVDRCPCCGPYGCQGLTEDPDFAWPPYPGAIRTLHPCFWQSNGSNSYTYLGSYSGQKGGHPECELDYTLRFALSFRPLDSDGSVRIEWAGHWAEVKFANAEEDGDSTLEISTGQQISVEQIQIDITPEDEFNILYTLEMCIGMGTLKATLHSALMTDEGAEVNGNIPIPLNTMSQPSITYSGADTFGAELGHALENRLCKSCWAGRTIPCTQNNLANCKDGIIPEGMIANLTFDMDFPELVCCDSLAEAMSSAIVMKSSQSNLSSVSVSNGASCCDAPTPNNMQQCIYSWVGGASVPCPNTSNPDRISVSASLQRYPDGYRLCGSFQHGGTGPGSATSGTFSGVSGVIMSLEDGPPDCRNLSGSIPMTCYVQGSPGFEVPVCGLKNLVMHVGSL
jgi:hypothetical protein